MWEKISFHKHLKVDYQSVTRTSKNAPEFNIETICLKILVLVYGPRKLIQNYHSRQK